MSTTRRVQQTPNYQQLEDPTSIKRILNELNRMQPEVELSIEGSSTVVRGKIIEWDPKRSLLIVHFKASAEFNEHLESKSGLRAFFKTKLFSTQLLFKTHAIRLSNQGAHFKVPSNIYEQQRRGALRVPLPEEITAELLTPVGVCKILDLSVTGAKIAAPKRMHAGVIYENIKFLIPSLPVMSQKLLEFHFEIKVNHRVVSELTSPVENTLGVQFVGLSPKQKAILKQFLTDALYLYFKNKKRV